MPQQHCNRPAAAGLLATLLLACLPAPAAPVSAAPPGPEELDNLTYQGILAHSVTLQAGRWEGTPYVAGGASRPAVGRVADIYLSADLDGDGRAEAVTLLWESSGGSGSNSYLAVAGWRAGRVVNLGTALVGDRVQLRAARIRDRQIELDVVQQGPGDAACCPAETATRRWQLNEDGLQEMQTTNRATLSLQDLQGQEWVLTHIARDEPVPEGVEVTLRFSDEGVSGRSGCNRYFGSASSADGPGSLSFGPLAGTRMACPEPAMSLETRYLQALGGVTRFAFLNGRLLLTTQQDDRIGMLLYAPRAAD